MLSSFIQKTQRIFADPGKIISPFQAQTLPKAPVQSFASPDCNEGQAFLDEEDVQDQLAVVVHDGGFAGLFQAWEIGPYSGLNVSPEGLLASRTHRA